MVVRVVRIMGERGRSRVDREVRMAICGVVGLWMCHCFMWFVGFGGRVIVEWYARRR